MRLAWLLLCLPGAAAAAASRGTAGAQVLLSEPGPLTLCAKGGSWARIFQCPVSAAAKVSIRRLSGVTRRDRGEARLWLDGGLLGPLRREHGARGWVSPRPVTLAPGEHRLEVECGEEAFGIAGLRVTIPGEAGRTASPQARAASAGPSTAAAAALPPAGPCKNLAVNSSWPIKNPRRSLVLSVTSGGKPAASGLLARLKRGQTATWWFKVGRLPEGSQVEHPPLLLTQSRRSDGRWLLDFQIDDAEMRKALEQKARGLAYAPRGYKPGQWNPMKLTLCPGGRFHIELSGGEVAGEFEVQDALMPLEIRASGLEIGLAGERP